MDSIRAVVGGMRGGGGAGSRTGWRRSAGPR